MVGGGDSDRWSIRSAIYPRKSCRVISFVASSVAVEYNLSSYDLSSITLNRFTFSLK